MRSAPKEDTESALALTRSRECTNQLISALPIFGSMGTRGVTCRAENRNVPRKHNGGRHGSSVFVVVFFFFAGSATQVSLTIVKHSEIVVFFPRTQVHGLHVLLENKVWRRRQDRGQTLRALNIRGGECTCLGCSAGLVLL